MDGKAVVVKLIGFYMLWISTLHAAEVAIVTHAPLVSVSNLSEALDAYGVSNDIVLLSDQDTVTSEDYKAAILVGLPVLEQWKKSSVPAISISVSRVMMNKYPDKLASGVYWTPPLRRQVALANAILGHDKKFGIFVDKRENWKKFGLSREYMIKNNVSVYFTEDYASLTHGLQVILSENDALIGVFDTDLYSSANLKNILITAYRLGRPLIGPASAYLPSGALATTYSDIDDIARRVNEVLQEGWQAGVWPAMDHNPYFHVGFNRQVGRSLNLELPDAVELAARLYQQEQQEQTSKN